MTEEDDGPEEAHERDEGRALQHCIEVDRAAAAADKPDHAHRPGHSAREHERRQGVAAEHLEWLDPASEAANVDEPEQRAQSGQRDAAGEE